MGPRATRLLGLVSFYVFLLTSLFAFTASAQEAQIEPSTVQPRIVQPVDETKLAVLKGNTHRLARSQFDQGAAPADLPMERMLLVLKRSPEQESALRNLLDNQQDKASPNYHKWLTPEQFGKQFGPADQDVQVVTSWLQSHGFRIGQVAKGRNIIEFSGTAAQVQEALHTSIHKYVVRGEEHWANANDPQIPAALTPVVAGVHTLHNFLKKPQIHVLKQTVAAKYVPGKPPQLTFSDGRHGLGPADYATIYNINPLYNAFPPINGTGITIAVVGRSNLYKGGTDVSDFHNYVFGGSNFPNIILNGPDPGDLGGGEEFEATLDATWSGAIAPGATVDFVVSATTNTTDGVDLSEAYIIDNNLANVMTESFGICEAAFTSTQAQGIAALAEQAAAQGVTYMVSTGDAGAEGCDDPNSETVATGPISVNILASTPYTVAVGGTEFNENGQDSKYWSTTNTQGTSQSVLSYIPENVWNESCTAAQCGNNANIAAGGGGASTFFGKPSWQPLILPGMPNDGARDLPDVSLTAAGHDPYLLCVEASCVPDSQGNFFLYFVAGTSASAPSFAGVMALVDQQMSPNSRQGQADYVLYQLAANESKNPGFGPCNASSTSTPPASTCIFNDVTVGNNAVPGEVKYGQSNAQYQSTVGYDLATGLGSVNVTNLVNKWNTVTFKPTTTTLSVNPTTIIHGQAVNVNITVAPQSGGGTPTGDVSLIASTVGWQRSVGFFNLSGGVVSKPTNLLPGGSYNLTAHYPGDGTYASSDSAAFGPVTVTAEPSNTTLSVCTYGTQNSSCPAFAGGPYGSFVYLRADVNSQSGFGTPTGNVNFMDGTASVTGDPYNLNSRGNTATPNGLFTFAAGAHSIIAGYNGDLSFKTSLSSPIPFTITQASTTTTATALGTTLSATVTTNSGGSGPTGTVTFFVDGAQAGSPVAVSSVSGVINPQTDAVTTGASATASSMVSKPPSSSFKAIYNGDTNYVASTSSTSGDFTFTAGAALVNVPSQGASGTVTLTLTAMNGFVGGVQFTGASCSGLPSESTCSFSPASLPGSGTTTLTITTKAPATAMLSPENRQTPGWWAATSGFALAGMLLLGVPSKRRQVNTLLSLVVVGLLTLSACGGGSGSSTKPPPDPGTPFGKSSVVVTATSGMLKHTVNFTLNVQ
jgi:hypothetical protein